MQQPGIVLLLLSASLIPTSLSAQPAPIADTLKQALTKKLQKLIPSGMTERQVLFQEVRAGSPTGGSYPFQVTAVLRDYGPGYPPNNYFGTTCINHFDHARFALFRNEFGEWDVEGAMTPNMNTQECKRNPAAGVSAIPLSTLTGTAASAGNPPPAPAPVKQGAQGQQQSGAGGVAQGRYECWGNGQARLLLNFTALSSSQYTGSDGKPGTYSYDPATTRITFKTGALAGAMPAGFYAVYYAPQGRPTVSFRNPSGSEASFCQLVR